VCGNDSCVCPFASHASLNVFNLTLRCKTQYEQGTKMFSCHCVPRKITELFTFQCQTHGAKKCQNFIL